VRVTTIDAIGTSAPLATDAGQHTGATSSWTSQKTVAVNLGV